MTTLELQAEDLASVRFAFSPLRECLGAFRAWADPAARGYLPLGLDNIYSDLSSSDWEPLKALALTPTGRVPDFLFPAPVKPTPGLSSELAELRRTPAEVVRADIAMVTSGTVHPSLRNGLKAPERFLQNTLQLIEEFWRRAVAPRWNLVRSKLESDLFFRAHIIALRGTEGVFNGLHPDISYHQRRLTIRAETCWNRTAGPRGILLMPSVFSGANITLTEHASRQPSIVYPSRGLADEWNAPGCHNVQALRRLVGKSCMGVLLHLDSPRTTMELANLVRLSKAAASEQVTKVWRSGLLDRVRNGRLVFYVLNEKGRALLSLFQG